MSDLRDNINNLLKQKGRFQIFIIVLLCFNSLTIGINNTITSFYTYVPDFYCPDDPYKGKCDLKINGTECPSGYNFDDKDDITIVVEWSLVCNRHLLAPLTNTLYFVGVTIGAIICGTLTDIFGRKKIIFGCLFMQAIISIGLFFSTNLEQFIFLRIIQGFLVQGLQSSSYTLIMEYSSPQRRTLTAIFWELNWTFGLAILGITSYFIRSWRILTLILTIPSFLAVFYFWIIPESISWLYIKGRYIESLQLTRKIARINKNTIVLAECNNITLEKVESNKNSENSKNLTDVKKIGFLNIFKCGILIKHLIVMIFVWFSVTLSYYGILYYLPNLAGQRHINFLIGAAIEAAAYIIAYFIFSKFGRRIPMSGYLCLNASLCLAIGLITKFIPHSTEKEYTLIVITLIAKGLAVSCFGGMFIYASELFPTTCRGAGLGICGLFARVGSLLAPQLMILMSYVPMLIISILLLISGLATIILPETLLTRLPNTIEDAIELWDPKNK